MGARGVVQFGSTPKKSSIFQSLNHLELRIHNPSPPPAKRRSRSLQQSEKERGARGGQFGKRSLSIHQVQSVSHWGDHRTNAFLALFYHLEFCLYVFTPSSEPVGGGGKGGGSCWILRLLSLQIFCHCEERSNLSCSSSGHLSGLRNTSNLITVIPRFPTLLFCQQYRRLTNLYTAWHKRSSQSQSTDN